MKAIEMKMKSAICTRSDSPTWRFSDSRSPRCLDLLEAFRIVVCRDGLDGDAGSDESEHREGDGVHVTMIGSSTPERPRGLRSSSLRPMRQQTRRSRSLQRGPRRLRG